MDDLCIVDTRCSSNIRMLKIDGHIGSIRIDNSDWGTIAFLIPRQQLYEDFQVVKELDYNCIYFLIDKDLENKVRYAYVGQAKTRNSGQSVLKRLKDHSVSKRESYTDKWEWAVVVTNRLGDWTLSDLNALEYVFCRLIPKQIRLNGNLPNSAGASLDRYRDKINQIAQILAYIGFETDSFDCSGYKEQSDRNKNAQHSIGRKAIDNAQVLRNYSITINDALRTCGRYQLVETKRHTWQFGLRYENVCGARDRILVNRKRREDALQGGIETAMALGIVNNKQMAQMDRYVEHLIKQR